MKTVGVVYYSDVERFGGVSREEIVCRLREIFKNYSCEFLNYDSEDVYIEITKPVKKSNLDAFYKDLLKSFDELSECCPHFVSIEKDESNKTVLKTT